MEINKYVRSYLAEGWKKCPSKPPFFLLYTYPLQPGSWISSISIVNDKNWVGCKVRSHPDSKANPLEKYQICSLNFSGLDLLEYEDKDCVQTTFPVASARCWLENMSEFGMSQQLPLRLGYSKLLSLSCLAISPRRQWNIARLLFGIAVPLQVLFFKWLKKNFNSQMENKYEDYLHANLVSLNSSYPCLRSF